MLRRFFLVTILVDGVLVGKIIVATGGGWIWAPTARIVMILEVVSLITAIYVAALHHFFTRISTAGTTAAIIILMQIPDSSANMSEGLNMLMEDAAPTYISILPASFFP